MENIISRTREKQELQEALESNNAEFLVAYGRRRVGKTFLITNFFESKDCMFFNIVGIKDGLLEEQLAEFAKAIGETFYSGATIATPKTWMKAFEELNNAIKNISKDKTVVLFFDEFPWMATPRSRLLQALEYYWNKYWTKEPRIKLILCGSSASWIIKNILYHKGGLHNRITRRLILKPFTLNETKHFLRSKGIQLNEKQILQLYMATGGVPHYLNSVKKGASAAQSINEICFHDTGILFDEFDKLFSSLFNDSESYTELIRIIAGSRYGASRSDIKTKAKLSSYGGSLSERLKDLESAGFIRSFLPIEHTRQGIYYRLIDEYCYFYLKWIEPEKRTLIALEENNEYWQSKALSPSFKSWAGYAFEGICYKHLSQIRKKLKISSIAIANSWRYASKKNSQEQGAQIDLLFDRNDDSITICEIKYTDKPFVIDKEYAAKLLNKVKILKAKTRTKKQIFISMISANSIKPTMYSEELISGVVALDDLFKE